MEEGHRSRRAASPVHGRSQCATAAGVNGWGEAAGKVGRHRKAAAIVRRGAARHLAAWSWWRGHNESSHCHPSYMDT